MNTEDEARRADAYYGNGRARRARENADRLASQPRPAASTGRKDADMVGIAVAGIVIIGLCAIIAGLLAWAGVWIWRQVL